MPIYEYECEKCGFKFELLTRHFKIESTHECPACAGISNQLISTPNFRIYGEGAHRPSIKDTYEG